MMSLPPSVKIFVSAVPVDARKSFDGLAGMVESEFGLEPLEIVVLQAGDAAEAIAQAADRLAVDVIVWEPMGAVGL